MGYAKVKGVLTSRIGRRVRYGRPKDVRERHGDGKKKGTIKDEVWANPSLNKKTPHPKSCKKKECWGDYSFCAQLISWDNGKHSIRLAYYRRRCREDTWEYASQTTVDSNWKTIKGLLQKTLAETKWFRKNPGPF